MLKIVNPPTGPSPNYYIIDLKSQGKYYNGSFYTASINQHYLLTRQWSGWVRREISTSLLPTCTAYAATIRKGISVHKELGSEGECQYASDEGLDPRCSDWRTRISPAFKYITPPSAKKSGKTGGCGIKAVKLQLANKRKCSGNSAREYVSFTNSACNRVALTIGSGGSLSNWVLDVKGNSLMTIRAKSPMGTTLKCKGAYLAPKPGCQDAGVFLQSRPYNWSIHEIRMGIVESNLLGTQSTARVLVAPSKASICRRVLGVSAICTSNKISLYTEKSRVEGLAWKMPLQKQYPAPIITSTASKCSHRKCDITVSVIGSSATSYYELIISKGIYSDTKRFARSSVKISDLLQCEEYSIKVRYFVGEGWNGAWSPYTAVKHIPGTSC